MRGQYNRLKKQNCTKMCYKCETHLFLEMTLSSNDTDIWVSSQHNKYDRHLFFDWDIIIIFLSIASLIHS